MKDSLPLRLTARLLIGLALIGLLLFLPAGGFGYRNAYLLIGLLAVSMLPTGLILLKKSPELLRKRLNTNEKEGEQKMSVLLSALLFIGGFVIAGLDYRFGISRMPPWVPIAASAAYLCGYGLYAEVLRENAYLSRVVELQEGQKLIDTGRYGVVRHPMYLSTLPLFLSMPLILGSYLALLPFLLYPFLLVRRIRGEEALLRAGLAGYEEYIRKVRYRLIPFIW